MIQSLPTIYKGIQFRSRLEARWAVLFDFMQFRWLYEPEGYQLPCGKYLPDFLLPDVSPSYLGHGLWVEIKPKEFTLAEMLKCAQLGRLTQTAVAMVSGFPDYRSYPTTHCLCADIAGGTKSKRCILCSDKSKMEPESTEEIFFEGYKQPDHLWGSFCADGIRPEDDKDFDKYWSAMAVANSFQFDITPFNRPSFWERKKRLVNTRGYAQTK